MRRKRTSSAGTRSEQRSASSGAPMRAGDLRHPDLMLSAGAPSERDNVHRRLDILAAEKDELEKAYQEQVDIILRYQRELRALEARCNYAEKCIDSADARRSELEQSAAAADAHAQDLQGAVESYRAHSAEQDAALSRIQGDNQELRYKYDAMTKRLSDVERSEQTYKLRCREAAGLLDTERTRLETALESMRKQLDRKDAEVANAHEKVREKAAMIDTLATTCREMESALDASCVEADTLKEQLDKERRLRDELKNELRRTQRDVEAITQQHAVHDNLVKSMKEERASLLETVEQLQTELAASSVRETEAAECLEFSEEFYSSLVGVNGADVSTADRMLPSKDTLAARIDRDLRLLKSPGTVKPDVRPQRSSPPRSSSTVRVGNVARKLLSLSRELGSIRSVVFDLRDSHFVLSGEMRHIAGVLDPRSVDTPSSSSSNAQLHTAGSASSADGLVHAPHCVVGMAFAPVQHDMQSTIHRFGGGVVWSHASQSVACVLVVFPCVISAAECVTFCRCLSHEHGFAAVVDVGYLLRSQRSSEANDDTGVGCVGDILFDVLGAMCRTDVADAVVCSTSVRSALSAHPRLRFGDAASRMPMAVHRRAGSNHTAAAETAHARVFHALLPESSCTKTHRRIAVPLCADELEVSLSRCLAHSLSHCMEALSASVERVDEDMLRLYRSIVATANDTLGMDESSADRQAFAALIGSVTAEPVRELKAMLDACRRTAPLILTQSAHGTSSEQRSRSPAAHDKMAVDRRDGDRDGVRADDRSAERSTRVRHSRQVVVDDDNGALVFSGCALDHFDSRVAFDLSGSFFDIGTMRRLDLSWNALPTLIGVALFRSVTVLDVSHNEIRSLRGVPHSVRTLNVAYNCLEDLSGLERATALSELIACNNRLSAKAVLAVVGNLPHLNAVDLRSNPIAEKEADALRRDRRIRKGCSILFE